MPKTLLQLIDLTPPSIRVNAEDCVVNKLVTGKSKSGRPIVKALVLSTHDSQGNMKTHRAKHQCYIEGLSDREKVNPKYVKVSCDCGFFWSHCEVALHRVGAADIIHSNGQPPNIKNPTYRPILCKHLIKLSYKIIHDGL